MATDSTSVHVSKVFTEKTETSSQPWRSNSQNAFPPYTQQAQSLFLPSLSLCPSLFLSGFHHLIAALYCLLPPFSAELLSLL